MSTSCSTDGHSQGFHGARPSADDEAFLKMMRALVRKSRAAEHNPGMKPIGYVRAPFTDTLPDVNPPEMPMGEET